MADTLSNLASELWGKFRPPGPDAYSRITQDPVKFVPGMNRAFEAEYIEPLMPWQEGQISVNPMHYSPVNPSIPSPIAHESVHALVRRAGLGPQAPAIAEGVPRNILDMLRRDPTYAGMGDYSGTQKQLADEGLAFSVGEPYATSFVEDVARKIRNKSIREQLLRLHKNGIEAKKSVIYYGR